MHSSVQISDSIASHMYFMEVGVVMSEKYIIIMVIEGFVEQAIAKPLSAASGRQAKTYLLFKKLRTVRKALYLSLNSASDGALNSLAFLPPRRFDPLDSTDVHRRLHS